MRILITEEALQTGGGHWPSYIETIAGGLREAGDQVDVLTHREATAEVVERVGGTPWFTRNCWLDPGSQGGVGGIRHNLAFRRELQRWLVGRKPYDWVCALTMRLQHLLAFALISRRRAVPDGTRFLLLFVQGFGQYAGQGQPTTFPMTASNRLARICFRLLASAVREGRVVLAAETHGMQRELQNFTGLPVELFPHPVGVKVERAKATSQAPGTDDSKITITCPGFARHEKGNDLLQEAIKELLAGANGARLRFVMQWPEPFEMPDGSMLGPDPTLMADSRVEFLNQSLDAGAYDELLARSDVVVLPYRRESYHNRVSRVAIEAAGRGIPLVYTSGTWSDEIAELAGCGVEIQGEASESIVAALEAAISSINELHKLADQGANQVDEYHSAETFRSNLNSAGA